MARAATLPAPAANTVLYLDASGSYAWTATTSWDTTYSFNAQYSPAQTGVLQVFATSTAGDDFAIVSNADTHTFYLPSASAAAIGCISQ